VFFQGGCAARYRPLQFLVSRRNFIARKVPPLMPRA
jgi:hypothetical protein